MSMIVPIVLISVVCGVFAKQMTPRLWSVVGFVVVASIFWFSLHH